MIYMVIQRPKQKYSMSLRSTLMLVEAKTGAAAKKVAMAMPDFQAKPPYDKDYTAVQVVEAEFGKAYYI